MPIIADSWPDLNMPETFLRIDLDAESKSEGYSSTLNLKCCHKHFRKIPVSTLYPNFRKTTSLRLHIVNCFTTKLKICTDTQRLCHQKISININEREISQKSIKFPLKTMQISGRMKWYWRTSADLQTQRDSCNLLYNEIGLTMKLIYKAGTCMT